MRSRFPTVTPALILAAAALIGVALPAAAQDAPKQEDLASRDAAFLRAYYKETALRDWRAAETAYRELLAKKPADAKLAARARLGLARTLRQLGELEEAGKLITAVREEFPDLPDLERKASTATTLSGAKGADDVAALVSAALAMKPSSAVAAFGDRGVPILAEELRGGDPDMVTKAAQALVYIGTPKANGALLDAIDDPRVLYPVRLLRASYVADHPVLRKAAHSADENVRAEAVRMGMRMDDTADWTFEIVLAQPDLARHFLEPDASNASPESWARLLNEGLASGDATLRRAGIEALAKVTKKTGHNMNRKDAAAVYAPPAAALADRAVVTALASAFDRSSVPTHGPRPSDELVDAIAGVPEGSYTALVWMLYRTDHRTSADVLSRAIEALPVRIERDEEEEARLLLDVLGTEPTPEQLRRIAAGGIDHDALEQYLGHLDDAGTLTEERLLALEKGARPDEEKRIVVASAIVQATQGDEAAAWQVPVFARYLDDTHAVTRRYGILGLRNCARGGSVDITPHRARIVEMLDDSYVEAAKGACDALVYCGREGAEELARSLKNPMRRRLTQTLLTALRKTREASAADEVLAALETGNGPVATSEWIKTLLALQGPEEALRSLDTLVRNRRMRMHEVLAAALYHRHVLGEDGVRDLYLTMIEIRGELVIWNHCDPFRVLSHGRVREIALAGLAGEAVPPRIWGANTLAEMRDESSWDALLEAATHPDPGARKAARDALAAIRQSAEELEALRESGAERDARGRAEHMLADPKPETRRAGIALAVAVGMPGVVDALTNLATEDEDEEVRADARQALLTLGKLRAEASPK